MTTVHAVTATQKTVDGPSQKDWRGGRGAGQNIIPASTGADKAAVKTRVKWPFDMHGISCANPECFCGRFNLSLGNSTTYQAVCQAMQEAAAGSLQGILRYTDEPLVSTDFLGEICTAIFDATAGLALDQQFIKVVAWYDNEIGYSNKVLDLISHIMGR